MADDFKSVDGKVMHISVYYVGFYAILGLKLIDEHGYDYKKEGPEYAQYFVLTTTGEPIGL